MDVSAKVSVYFDDPFWVGLYEREEDGHLTVCRIVFGAEPKDYEVYAYLLANWGRLRFSPPVSIEARLVTKANPKRMQRAVQRQLSSPAAGTKAQQAMKLAQESCKEARKTRRKSLEEAEKERRFALHIQKKKQKHKGR
ncbi:YjdF family protein [Intestinibacillus massiliensis]|uniref:YjdF family protein n=1 Tax=Intestinibacillus massiliensis TaxID=1871029 RepID=UPI000B35420B|nr:YjdF family protein [Intestinibacillus massiliensis]